MKDAQRTIDISTELYKILELKAKQKQFSSVDDYVEHILFQMMQAEAPDDLDPEEEMKIKERLERLGYL
ncbi:MAG: hypothetical protein ACFFAU_21265 [Candidatus Hodarchaeota archaeon]